MNQKIMSRLQTKIKEMSYNDLRRVYPEQIQAWLGTTGLETEGFLLELVDQRLAIDKYDFECSCGNQCTAFGKKLKNHSYQCRECGKEYTYERIIQCGNLLYELDKREFLYLEKESVDFKEAIRESRKVVHISEVKGEDNIMDKKKEIFIGSSNSVLPKVGEIARYIDDLGGVAKPWNTKGLFVAGQYTFDSLIKIAHKMDGAIFMFNGEDETWYNQTLKSEKEVRDNVLLEYGLFAGILGRDKVAFICENNPKIASDLSGITYIEGNQTEHQIKPDIEAWLNQV